MSTAIQKKCPWRGPKNSNLYNNPEKIIHGVDPDDERSKQQIAMCGVDVSDKLKNKAKAATETSPKKFKYSFKKRDEVGGLWTNIAEIKSFLWVVLALEKMDAQKPRAWWFVT